MDSVYQNPSCLFDTAASHEKYSQYRGKSTKEQENEMEVCASKWTKVLLVVSAVCLVFALGGLCVLAILYVSVSVQLSAQKTNGTIMVKKIEELTANYTTVREQLSIYEAQFCDVKFKCEVNLAARKMYLFSVDKLSWSSSRAFCVSKGADLVSITSRSEQEFLFSKIKQWHWIGLNDMETEGHWVWVNNQTLEDTGVQFWHQRKYGKSEPDNWKAGDPNGENCAFMANYFSYLDSWYDYSCKNQINFICEKKY